MVQIKTLQRIRDPLHGLIEFNSSELERVLWEVVQTRPFQRLRRIKQLGFSDLVYPGATHSRFAHSLGVFHTARQLMEIVRRQIQEDYKTKEDKALAAALVHDVGHGAFSHAFEAVGARLSEKFGNEAGLQLANHEYVSDQLIRNSDISKAFDALGTGFASDIADIINGKGRKTVHHAVVSSQFDADRLDYMQRDRLMTGTRHAVIDFPWLIANLEISSVEEGVDEHAVGKTETFVLGSKAIPAAEAYVLGLFQLYPTVYFHKATRGAEKLFIELFFRLVTLVMEDHTNKTGLSQNHPLVLFAWNLYSIDHFLNLDDSIIWGALSQLSEAEDRLISDFACRLRDRQLFKCYDIRAHVTRELNPKSEINDDITASIDKCCTKIENKLNEWKKSNEKEKPRILCDKSERSPYKSVNESAGPLDRINVLTSNKLVDLKECSSVISALKMYKLFRVYIDRDDAQTSKEAEIIARQEIEDAKR